MPLLLTLLLVISPFQIEEVEVLAERTPIASEAYQLVAQVSGEQIATMPIANVADILVYLPGVDVRSRGSSNTQNDVSLFGGTFDQVLILLNGIPISDPQTGHYSMHLPVAPALIERIDVLQSNYRVGALTGAINIITRHPQQDDYSLQLSGGTNSFLAPLFACSWKRDQVQVNASAEYARSDGYYAPTDDAKEQAALRNTDYRLANLYVQTRWKGLDVQVGAQYKDAGLGTGYGFASIDQFDATRTMMASARYVWSTPTNWTIEAQAAYRGNYDRYEWHRGTISNLHWTHNTQAKVEAMYQYRLGHTSFGAEARNEYIRSTNMGEHYRTHVTLHAGQEFVFQNITSSLHLAGHYNTWFGWYGSGDARIAYSFLRSGNIALHAGRSLRMPTWTDLYYHAGVQRGSTDLKAEQAWHLALNGGYEWNWNEAGRFALSGDAFYRWGEDIIDWTYNTTDSLFYATNQNKVNTFGVEVGATYRLNAWLRQVSISYAYTDLSLDLTKAKSNYLDYLRHKVVLQIDHGIYVWSKGRLAANWSLRWQDREGSFVDIYGKAGNAYQSVLLLDGSIYMECAHARIALECTNMTNRHYYEYGGILMPGAQGKIVVTAKF